MCTFSPSCASCAIRLIGLGLLAAGRAAGWDLVIEKASDFTCTGGAAFINKGAGSAPLPNIRSGDQQKTTECTFVTPAPEAITRVELNYRYVVGYSPSANEVDPVLSVWATNKGDTDEKQDVRLYESPSLPDDKDKTKWNYSCTKADKKDCCTSDAF